MNQTSGNIPRSHDDLLHQVFDQATVGFQVIDRDWRYVFVNEAVAKQGRKTVHDLLGKTMMEVYPGIDKMPFFEQLKKCMDEGVGIRMENEFNYPGGEKGWFQLYIHPWSDGVMIFSADINDHKLAEQNLGNLIETFPKDSLSDEGKKKLEDLKNAFDQLGKPSVTIIH